MDAQFTSKKAVMEMEADPEGDNKGKKHSLNKGLRT
jgi:hypothetical protein